jgi:glycine/D-amino acid oxidase-like deaminating enzyme
VETAEVIVAGGGIIGLSTALELARHGFRVRVLEKGRAMSEASWAAAGMLSPHDPAHSPELAKLADLSIRLYPEYLSTVEGLSGRSVRLRTQAAISTDEEDGTSVAMNVQEAQRRIPGLAMFCVLRRCTWRPAGVGKPDRASAGYQRWAAGDWERRMSALLGGDGTLS